MLTCINIEFNISLEVAESCLLWLNEYYIDDEFKIL